MLDQLVYILFLAIVAIPFLVFRRQIKKVRGGASGKAKAVALFVAYAILPVIAYLTLHLALVGIEEVTDRSLIGEGMARGLIPALVMGLAEVLVLTVVFVAVVAFTRAGSVSDVS